MVITREHINGYNHYAIDGERVSKGELEARCVKYLSGYGLNSMLHRLHLQNKVIVEVDGAYAYAGLREMYAEDELKSARKKLHSLKRKLRQFKTPATRKNFFKVEHSSRLKVGY